ncbi:MAG: DNA polymerase III subunit gamma/tau [Candidatus Buchananbacteria bacterium]|nr:DNA polymerase III subunit gamma/tau [Candidatus Buchananbacteria bacterium]
MPALYRKYRPQKFADVVGQNHVKITLQHQLERGEVAHAYLLTGPRGLGKTTLARIFSKAINCEKRGAGESEPCNDCDSCREIDDNRSLDVMEIDAASHTGVDNVRENIIDNARFNPVRRKFKVFIIDEVHMLSTAAFNALLKTLEEPPAYVVFVLCTTEIHKLPATIISRCQRFDLKKIPAPLMIERLETLVAAEKKSVVRPVIEQVVRIAGGCVRDAESLLTKILALGDEITVENAQIVLPRSDFGRAIELIEFIADRNPAAGIELINNLIDEGVSVPSFTDDLLELLRRLLLAKTDIKLASYGVALVDDEIQQLERLSTRYTTSEIITLLELTAAAREQLKTAAITQLPLEIAIVKATQAPEPRFDSPSVPQHPSAGQRIASTLKPIKDQGEKVGAKVDQMVAHIKEQLKPAPTVEPVTIVESIVTTTESVAPVLEDTDVVTDESVQADLPAQAGGEAVDIKIITSKWSTIVDALLERNYTLASMLKISEPKRCDGNILIVGVKNSFYKERLEQASATQVIKEVIFKVTGASVGLKGVVVESLNEAPVQSQITLEDIKPAASADVVQDVIGLF